MHEITEFSDFLKIASKSSADSLHTVLHTSQAFSSPDHVCLVNPNQSGILTRHTMVITSLWLQIWTRHTAAMKIHQLCRNLKKKKLFIKKLKKKFLNTISSLWKYTQNRKVEEVRERKQGNEKLSARPACQDRCRWKTDVAVSYLRVFLHCWDHPRRDSRTSLPISYSRNKPRSCVSRL